MSLRAKFLQSFRHAFSTKTETNPLASEELALLDHIATKVVSRHMETPMILLLESVGPMNFLGSQALHVLSPLIDLLGENRDTTRIAEILERRDSIQQLITLIEKKSGKGDAPSHSHE